ncbi:Transporter [Brevinematales bacterium NS]|nr:hypothetical protein [Brevinematales bacterium]QJR22202.1 Transporter [Brevinematales bacterium NS]
MTNYNAFLSILLGTIIGAFSPFCSCSVIPVITSLLIAGVPLGAVMSFWIASPSMDPEIFFLSVASLGWPLAIARLIATFFLSLAGGFIAQFFVSRGLFGKNYLKLKKEKSYKVGSFTHLLKKLKTFLSRRVAIAKRQMGFGTSGIDYNKKILSPPYTGKENIHLLEVRFSILKPPYSFSQENLAEVCCSSHSEQASAFSLREEDACCSRRQSKASPSCCDTQPSREKESKRGRWSHFIEELNNVLFMVGKYLFIAYLLEAIITFYLPREWVTFLLGIQNPLSVLYATLLGVPLYTTNLTALGVIGGLLSNNMSGGAALAFLIAGATTTLPAMSAVYGIVSKRVFLLYLGVIIVGALFCGYSYQIVEFFFLH